MDIEDLVENLDAGVFSLLIPIGVLVGAVVVRRAAKRFQRVSRKDGAPLASSGLTGGQVALKLLAACGLEDVAVVPVRGRDVYDPVAREVRLSTPNFVGRSLAAVATAAHEVGHAQQFASKLWLCQARRVFWPICRVLTVLALLLLLGASVLPLRNIGLALLFLSVLAVVLQVTVTLPLERDASRRATDLVRTTGLIAPEEAPLIGRYLHAAWLTYVAATARHAIGLLLIGVLTLIWTVGSDHDPGLAEALGAASLFQGQVSPPGVLPMLLIAAARLVPFVVVSIALGSMFRSAARDKPTLAERAVARNTAAMALYAQGKFAAAVRELDVAIALLPTSAAAYYNRGCASFQLGLHDNALADFDRALSLDPSLPDAYRMRGNLWLDKGDYDRALADFRSAVQHAPTDASAWRDRGLTYLWRGDYDQALADLDEAIRLDATDAVAFNNRGVARLKRGEYAEARSDLLEAIRLDPKLPNPQKHLASMEAACQSAESPQRADGA
jgi:Zn-dependent membrane protease YugP/Flp pilus assembly protein TadD